MLRCVYMGLCCLFTLGCVRTLVSDLSRDPPPLPTPHPSFPSQRGGGSCRPFYEVLAAHVSEQPFWSPVSLESQGVTGGQFLLVRPHKTTQTPHTPPDHQGAEPVTVGLPLLLLLLLLFRLLLLRFLIPTVINNRCSQLAALHYSPGSRPLAPPHCGRPGWLGSAHQVVLPPFLFVFLQQQSECERVTRNL